MIEVNKLTKEYGRIVALNNISFSSGEGEILGFLGPNGAGKTTTMRILTGYMPPTSGTAQVAGYDVFNDSLEVRRRVGYLPETVPLYRDMTSRGYLDFMAQVRRIEHRAKRIDEVLDMVGMSDRARSPIRNLSKGMRQRIGLAQAIIHDPKVLILDEPTIGLDPHQSQEIRFLIRELGKTRTVLLSTHILPEAEQICDRVIIIDHGRIVAEDTPNRLRDRLHQGGRLYLRVSGRSSNEDVLRLLQRVPGVKTVETGNEGYIIAAKPNHDVRPAVSAAIVGQGLELLELRPLAVTLEEIFLELTSQREPAPSGGKQSA